MIDEKSFPEKEQANSVIFKIQGEEGTTTKEENEKPNKQVEKDAPDSTTNPSSEKSVKLICDHCDLCKNCQKVIKKHFFAHSYIVPKKRNPTEK